MDINAIVADMFRNLGPVASDCRVGEIGMEAEAIVTTIEDGRRVRASVAREFRLGEENGWKLEVSAPDGTYAGTICFENGEGQMEISTGPYCAASRGHYLVQHILSRLPRNWEVFWQSTDLTGLPLDPWLKARHQAIEAMVRQEGGEGGHWMARYCAGHYSFRVDVPSPAGIVLMTGFGYICVALARLLEEAQPDPGNRIGRAWLSHGGWGDPSRLPSLRLFRDADELVEAWCGAKRSVTCRNGLWVIDDRTTKPEFGDPEQQSTHWWDVRPNGVGTPAERVELRTPNAMHPHRQVETSFWLRAIANRMLQTGTLPFRWTEGDWNLARASHQGWRWVVANNPSIIPSLVDPELDPPAWLLQSLADAELV